jgi:hypothetical protein
MCTCQDELDDLEVSGRFGRVRISGRAGRFGRIRTSELEDGEDHSVISRGMENGVAGKLKEHRDSTERVE